MTRTDQILRELWYGTDQGTLTIGWPRLLDRLTFTPTPEDIQAVLDTKLVEQIPGGGGPSRFRVTVTLEDLIHQSTGLINDPDLDTLNAALAVGEEA